MSEDILPGLEEEVTSLWRSLSPETDRGCALMTAAYLDDQLSRMLRAYLADDSKTIATHFDGTGPMAAFSSRIDLCYLLGLLPPNTRRDLDLIRRIRNDFAHLASPLSFADEGIANRCKELSHCFFVVSDRPRARFTAAAMGACGVIHVALRVVSHCQVPPDFAPSEETMSTAAEEFEA